jgi:hypothetical protein
LIDSPEKLSAFLDLLVESGAEEFEGFGIHVRFSSAVFNTASSEEPAPTRAQPRDMWEEVYGGHPPKFPGK